MKGGMYVNFSLLYDWRAQRDKLEKEERKSLWTHFLINPAEEQQLWHVWAVCISLVYHERYPEAFWSFMTDAEQALEHYLDSRYQVEHTWPQGSNFPRPVTVGLKDGVKTQYCGYRVCVYTRGLFWMPAWFNIRITQKDYEYHPRWDGLHSSRQC